MRWQALRQRARDLIREGLAPGSAAAAVFVGIFIANVPIYGFQALAAIGIAVALKLNKPLTLAATFINNPLLQPFLIVSSVELGNLILRGKLLRPAMADLTMRNLQTEFSAWLVGSLVLGALLGGAGAFVTFLFFRLKGPGDGAGKDAARFVNGLFVDCSSFDRRFVRWKIRLDRIFDLLVQEDLGSGTIVDLGCGYGIALGFAAFRDGGRRLVGFDLDERRIAAARHALRGSRAELRVGDMRAVEIPQAGLILMLDVLQYLDAPAQRALLTRCAAALEPGGRLIFRVHDRERGLQSKVTMAFDRLIFLLSRTGRPPVMLRAIEYRQLLVEAGMQVEERPLPNRLPLAHRVFVARRPQ